MINEVKQHDITHFGNDTLHVIDDSEIFADGEVILADLVERYESHPGFMFVCRTLPKIVWDAHYCWWLFTNKIAVHYERKEHSQTLHFWGTSIEVQRIRSLAGEWCPF